MAENIFSLSFNGRSWPSAVGLNAGIFDTKKTAKIVFSSNFYHCITVKINKESLHIITTLNFME